MAAMHALYKVPGGKLVVVDLQVADGRIVQAQLSGDFFLEPPEALACMDAALTGLAVDAGEGRIAQAVAQALPEGTEMFGLTPEAVAVVVQRALS